MKSRRLQLESLEGRAMMATLYPGLSVADVIVNEGAKTVTATITRSDTGFLTGTVDWSLKPGTAGTADYRNASGRVTFQPRETSKPITIAITDDLLAEATEEFFLQLANPKWGKIVDGTASIKITDNDAAPPPPPPPPTPTDPPPASNTAGLTGPVGTRQGVTAPTGAIVVTPSTTRLISSAAANATIFLKAGTYDISIIPKAGQRFVGEYGAVLKSATKQFAFWADVSGVIVENLVVDGYNPGSQACSFGATNGWTIRNCEIRNSRSEGLGADSDTIIENCWIHHNEQLGLKIGGSGLARNIMVRNTLVERNNLNYLYDPYWEAGGSKIWQTDGTLVENCEFRHNGGIGLWFDGDNINATLRNNYCHHNDQSGIFYEISGKALIEGNRCDYNGLKYDDPWPEGAGILVKTSRDVTVRGNVCTNNDFGIAITSQDEGYSDLTPGLRYYVSGIVVSGNTLSGNQRGSGVWDDGSSWANTTGDVTWDGVLVPRNFRLAR